jgi:hypothetical protein
MLGLGVSDDGFDRRAAAELAFDGLGDATSLAGDIDLELMTRRGVVTAIAAVGDDAGEVRPIWVSISGITAARVWPS